MLPVIALVGRPNVGKSTLFNRLTRSRDALVCGQVEGGSVEQLDGSLYLVRATATNVRIPKEGA